MKAVGPDYIDYFQDIPASQDGTSNYFGIRLREGFWLVVVRNRDGQVYPSGDEFHIPVQLETLPCHVTMIIEDHVLNYPASDLIEVMTGKKSFQDALVSTTKSEVQPEVEQRKMRLAVG